MAEKLRILTRKKLCEMTHEQVEIIEIYKDIIDGDNLITSFLTEVGCLNFRRCKISNCLLKKDIPSAVLAPYPKGKKIQYV